MVKLRLKSPFLCLFWSLPLIASLGIDVFIWLNGGIGFHFSEIGYLFEHYLPEALPALARQISEPFLFKLIDDFLHIKTVILGAVIAVIPILIINRPRREAKTTLFPRIRR